MSANSSWVGIIFADLASRAHTASRSSGTATRPILASRVENGYFVASAAWVAVSALNRADLPTFGKPTIPQLKPMSLPTPKRHDRPPRSGPGAGHLVLTYGRLRQNAGRLTYRSSRRRLGPINQTASRRGKWVPACAGTYSFMPRRA